MTGTVVDGQGQAVAGVCVTASSGTALPGAGDRTTVTSAGGLFMIADLPAGPYLLHYRNCLASPGDVSDSLAAALGPGPLTAPPVATRGYVAGGHVMTLGHVTLRSRAAVQAPRMPARPTSPAARSVTKAQLRRRPGGRRLGGIAGRVLGPLGRAIKGLCFSINADLSALSDPIGSDGRYSTEKSLLPGTYTVDFDANCGPPSQPASANWTTEWFRGHLRASAADPVVVKAGKITRGIDGRWSPAE